MPTPIYIDHNATTPVLPEVARRIQVVLAEVHGNPSSYHRAGAAARAVLDEAREHLAAALGARPENLVYTSGGTEADRLAILGAAAAVDGPGHILVSAIEHPAVLGAARDLARAGWEVGEVAPGPSGRVEPEAVARALRPETRIVALMAANNETGVLQPVDAVGRMVRSHGAFFLVDAVQAFGKVPVDVGTLEADAVAISGHKVYAPKGTGVLWLRPGARWAPPADTGKQEGGRRGGTENLPGIAGFGEAARLLVAGRAGDPVVLAALRDRLERGVCAAVSGTVVHGGSTPRTPNTTCIGFPGCAGEVLLARLDLAGVQASLGAACASGSMQPSHVLLSMGLPRDLAAASIRFSIGIGNTEAEVDRVIAIVCEAVRATRDVDHGA